MLKILIEYAMCILHDSNMLLSILLRTCSSSICFICSILKANRLFYYGKIIFQFLINFLFIGNFIKYIKLLQLCLVPGKYEKYVWFSENLKEKK